MTGGRADAIQEDVKLARKWQEWSLAVVLAAVFVGGLVGLATERREVFPFFHWFLFSEVPGKRVLFEVALVEVGPDGVEQYQRWENIRLRGKRLDGGRVVQALGRAVQRGDTRDAAARRALLESVYLPGGGDYALLRKEEDPLERWRGQDSTFVELARFRAGEEP